MKRILLLLLLAACRTPTAPTVVPNLAGVWHLNGAVTDSTATCRFTGLDLYISQTDTVSADSMPFTAQTQLGDYLCTDGFSIPFPSLGGAGEVYADRNVNFLIFPFSFTGRVSQESMSGTVEFANGALGSWVATRVSR